jgi:hypothetical protein
MVCVWGVVIGGTSTYPDANLLFTANVVANLLDPDNTGRPKNEAIRAKFAIASGKHILGGGSTADDEANACDGYGEKIAGYICYTLQTHKMNGNFAIANDFYDGLKKFVNEEVFHMYTHALAKVYPDQFYEEDFTTSVMCREMARLQCLQPGWVHLENLCPNGNPDPSGVAPASPLQPKPDKGEGCTGANCDCVEFFHQAVLGLIG